MNLKSRQWLWLLLLMPIAVGVWRLRFDTEILDLLPTNQPVVEGLKLYQQHFSNARELIIAVRAPTAEAAETAARDIAEHLRGESNLISQAIWQPPWLEHPEQTSELIAYLWLNRPPEVFAGLAARLAETNLPALLADVRDQLTTSMSPNDIAMLSYDPLGLTRLPDDVAGGAQNFRQGQELFSSTNGTFRILFVQANRDLKNYDECINFLTAVRQSVASVPTATAAGVSVAYTGRPVFVAEISTSMKNDIIKSVGGTSVIIAILFWLAHRRVKPMLWLLTLLALILATTLALGGLLFGHISVVSMGFAAILLGLAVDYAVVHYQEALAHPDLSVPEVRGAIAPSIFWAAVTTITSFIVLNFGGLPGLAQLGSLVAIGVTVSACVMIFAFLPPLFPERRKRKPAAATGANTPEFHAAPALLNPARVAIVLAFTVLIIGITVVTLLSGIPKMDPTANSLRPRHSEAYDTLDGMKSNLGQGREPILILVAGQNETEVAQRLNAITPILKQAITNGALSSFNLPTPLWPQPAAQTANRETAQRLIAARDTLHAAILTNGFTENSFGLANNILNTWQRAIATPQVFWPTNEMSSFIFGKLVARSPTNFYAVGFLSLPPDMHPNTDPAFAQFAASLPRDNVWLSGWELLGGAILSSVKANLWKLVLPIVFLILLSLWLAFHRFTEVFLSLAILFISGLCLMTAMRFAGWSWNLLNLMGLPLILGTGVDYSIFMQLALRRHHGDLAIAHRSVGRALLLCGATAISGFGALGFSSNAGMASFGRICAIGIASNMLISVFLLPVWWRALVGRASRVEGRGHEGRAPKTPSVLYGIFFWKMGIRIAGAMPIHLCYWLADRAADIYWILARHRRKVVIQNLLPVLNDDHAAAKKQAKQLFRNFTRKLIDLWRYEDGKPIDKLLGKSFGWENFEKAQSQKRGVLLLTLHLGNWEFGAPWLAQRGTQLHVVTLTEPSADFTEFRKAARARWNVETLVVGDDPFAFVEIIRRLEAGATIALLVDRPTKNSSVDIELFGRPFAASVAAAELARASGCAILPVYLPRENGSYTGHILPPVEYERATLRDREARRKLVQEIMRAFEPAIRQHSDQWYHFVPVWPE